MVEFDENKDEDIEDTKGGVVDEDGVVESVPVEKAEMDIDVEKEDEPMGGDDSTARDEVEVEDDANFEANVASMREMVLYVTKTLAHEPDDVGITEEVEKGRVVFSLSVGDSDKGRIIGKEGRTAQALRSLLRVAGVKYGISTRIEIL